MEVLLTRYSGGAGVTGFCAATPEGGNSIILMLSCYFLCNSARSVRAPFAVVKTIQIAFKNN